MHRNKSTKKVLSFEQTVRELCPIDWNDGSPEPLATMDYLAECELKNKAFGNFLKASGINTRVEPIVPSPKPRHYRTTTKRRVFCERDGIGLGFSSSVKAGAVAKSALEPVEHQKIYEYLQRTLSAKSYSHLARALNWIIIRGNYDRQFLILNLYKMDGSIVRKLKQLSEQLQKEKLLDGALSYFDPTRSEYYLEAVKPPRGLQIKHLFGQKLLGLKVNDTLMRYSPTGFSQINESMVPKMIDIAQDMLQPSKDDHLLDLYCGYGLFSHTIGKGCKKVTGIELSSDAISSAREISKRMKTQSRMKFHADSINSTLINEKLSAPNSNEILLLDPPRKGCEKGVITQLAKRKPKRVLHIFCGTDEVPVEIKQWQQNGYIPKKVQALDMFAGTANLETMVLLEKQ